MVLVHHAAGHLVALHRRVNRRQDIRDLMLRFTRENLAPKGRLSPAKLVGLGVDDPSFLQAARPMSAVDSGQPGIAVPWEFKSVLSGFKSASHAGGVSSRGLRSRAT